jgi:hypothetical protein
MGINGLSRCHVSVKKSDTAWRPPPPEAFPTRQSADLAQPPRDDSNLSMVRIRETRLGAIDVMTIQVISVDPDTSVLPCLRSRDWHDLGDREALSYGLRLRRMPAPGFVHRPRSKARPSSVSVAAIRMSVGRFRCCKVVWKVSSLTDKYRGSFSGIDER